MLRVFTDPACLEHRGHPGYPEVPERLERVLAGLPPAEVAPAVDDLDEALLAVHEERYLERFARAVARGDALLDSADNPLSAGTWRAARAAAGATVAALDWALAGRGRQAFAAVRPPGHHAERGRAMGFCFFANVAVAAERARLRHGLEKVAIVDFDVHHGNGTQHLFEERSDVFYVSLHQFPFYPGTGAASERGRGAGEGFTLNLPLPAGTGDEGYARGFVEGVLPALRHFAPDLLLVSAGFDAWQGDPLGGMRVSIDAFGRWAEPLAEVADGSVAGSLVAVLEGGYDLAALPALAAACVKGLTVGDV